VETETLARHVFGLQSAPPGLAARLLFGLLAEDPRVQVNGRGVWSMVPRSEDRNAELGDLEWAVVDVETTGASPRKGDRVIEVAVVVARGDHVIDAWSSLVNPGCAIPDWIRHLTGIDDAAVADAPTFVEIAEEVRARLAGRVFVAHNVGFDWRFVSEEMRRAGAGVPDGPRLCTVRLARRAIPGLRRRGLDSVTAFYGVEIDGRHRALGDARATAEILNRMLTEAERRGVSTWSELEAWLAGRPPGRRRNGGRA
jgi:DNA polymerase-3 subunit epsilon